MTFLYVPFNVLNVLSKNLEEPQNKTPFARKSFFDYHSFDCFSNFGYIGGMISLPGNSWLNHYLIPILPKLATAEHHLGTTEYILMAIAVVGGVGIGMAYAKYISKIQFLQKMLKSQGF
jgi:hypothetical protein